MKIQKKEIEKLWGTGETLTLNGRKYRVGKMSYGDYFLEPTTWQGSETDGHSPETLWLEPVEGEPLVLEVQEGA